MHRRKFGVQRDEHSGHLTRALLSHALATFGGAEQVFSNREENKDIAARSPAGFGLLNGGREFDFEAAPREVLSSGYQASRTVVNQQDDATILDVFGTHGALTHK